MRNNPVIFKGARSSPMKHYIHNQLHISFQGEHPAERTGEIGYKSILKIHINFSLPPTAL